MAYHSVQFPPEIEYGAVSAITYETEVIRAVSGHETRNQKRKKPLLRFDVSHGVKTQAQLDELIAHFRNRQGKTHSFPFRDWTDYELDRELQIDFATNGAITDFQLIKTYTDAGGHDQVRDIKMPVDGTLILEKSGVDLVESTDYTVNYATGEVSLATALADGDEIRASGEFLVKVRYDTDELKAKITHYDTYAWGQIPIVEVLD